MKFRHVSPVGKVRLWLKKTGSPVGYLQVEIYSDDNIGQPDEVLTNGASAGIPMSSVSSSYGWVDFDFDLDSRPGIEQNVLYHIVLKPSGYTYSDGVTEIIWGCDQTSPHYVDGAGKTYDGADWTTIGTATDFAFEVYTGARTGKDYSSIRNVESSVMHFTNAGTFDFSSDSKLTPTRVYDFGEIISNQIDLWLRGAGFTTPVTDTTIHTMLEPYATAGVAMWCEMTARTSGVRSGRSSNTPVGGFRDLYENLRDGLENGGEIEEALLGLGLAKISTREIGRGLTSGGIDEDERDDQLDDDTLIRVFFDREMWDNV